MVSIIFILFLIVIVNLSKEIAVGSLVDTGTPAGYLSDCPNMDIIGRLTNRAFRRLSVRVRRNKKYRIFPWHVRSDQYDPKSGKSVALRIKASGILNSNAKTLVFLDGYLDYFHYPHVTSLMEAYDELGYNFIAFETFDIYARPYTDTVRLMEPIGEALADFMAHLTHIGLIQPENIEVFGVSLGGQQASPVGRFYFEKVGKKVSRITAAGASGPCFRNLKEGRRLAPGDAERVDVIHTNVDGLGSGIPMGHLDYYFNGGEYMPLTGGGLLLPCFELCSHVFSYVYWYVSLTFQNEFIAVQCENVAKARQGDCFDGEIKTNLFGLKANFSQPGIYFVQTSGEYPFYLGENGLRKGTLGINSFLNNVISSDKLVV